MTAISFLFSSPLAMWVLRLVAPAEATGAGMRSEREQLIKSSSSRSTESQFCLPSTMISFYLKVMSYGTFASGNTMSSISMFHLLHKQGQVIPAGFYLGNQSNWLHSQGTGGRRESKKKREHEKERQVVFFMDHNTVEKLKWCPLFELLCMPVFPGVNCVQAEKQLMSAWLLYRCHILRSLNAWRQLRWLILLIRSCLLLH